MMTLRRFALVGVAMVVALVLMCLAYGHGRPAAARTTDDQGRTGTSTDRGTGKAWHTVASWYAKPGDRWARRFPAAYYCGWPLTVGEFWPGVAFNGLPLFSVVRVTCAATGLSILAVVVDRIGRENSPEVRERIDLTWQAFSRLADPRRGLVPVEVVEVGP